MNLSKIQFCIFNLPHYFIPIIILTFFKKIKTLLLTRHDGEGGVLHIFLYSLLLTTRCFKENQIYLDQKKVSPDLVCGEGLKQSKDLYLSQTLKVLI